MDIRDVNDVRAVQQTGVLQIALQERAYQNTAKFLRDEQLGDIQNPIPLHIIWDDTNPDSVPEHLLRKRSVQFFSRELPPLPETTTAPESRDRKKGENAQPGSPDAKLSQKSAVDQKAIESVKHESSKRFVENYSPMLTRFFGVAEFSQHFNDPFSEDLNYHMPNGKVSSLWLSDSEEMIQMRLANSDEIGRYEYLPTIEIPMKELRGIQIGNLPTILDVAISASLYRKIAHELKHRKPDLNQPILFAVNMGNSKTELGHRYVKFYRQQLPKINEQPANPGSPKPIAPSKTSALKADVTPDEKDALAQFKSVEAKRFIERGGPVFKILFPDARLHHDPNWPHKDILSLGYTLPLSLVGDAIHIFDDHENVCRFNLAQNDGPQDYGTLSTRWLIQARLRFSSIVDLRASRDGQTLHVALKSETYENTQKWLQTNHRVSISNPVSFSLNASPSREAKDRRWVQFHSGKIPAAIGAPAPANPDSKVSHSAVQVQSPSQLTASVVIPADAIRVTQWFTKWPQKRSDIVGAANQFSPTLSRSAMSDKNWHEYEHSETGHPALYLSQQAENLCTSVAGYLSTEDNRQLSLTAYQDSAKLLELAMSEKSYQLGTSDANLADVFISLENPESEKKREVYILLNQFTEMSLASLRALKKAIDDEKDLVRMKEIPENGTFVITSPYTRWVIAEKRNVRQAVAMTNSVLTSSGGSQNASGNFSPLLQFPDVIPYLRSKNSSNPGSNDLVRITVNRFIQGIDEMETGNGLLLDESAIRRIVKQINRPEGFAYLRWDVRSPTADKLRKRADKILAAIKAKRLNRSELRSTESMSTRAQERRDTRAIAKVPGTVQQQRSELRNDNTVLGGHLDSPGFHLTETKRGDGTVYRQYFELGFKVGDQFHWFVFSQDWEEDPASPLSTLFMTDASASNVQNAVRSLMEELTGSGEGRAVSGKIIAAIYEKDFPGEGKGYLLQIPDSLRGLFQDKKIPLTGRLFGMTKTNPDAPAGADPYNNTAELGKPYEIQFTAPPLAQASPDPSTAPARAQDAPTAALSDDPILNEAREKLQDPDLLAFFTKHSREIQKMLPHIVFITDPAGLDMVKFQLSNKTEYALLQIQKKTVVGKNFLVLDYFHKTPEGIMAPATLNVEISHISAIRYDSDSNALEIALHPESDAVVRRQLANFYVERSTPLWLKMSEDPGTPKIVLAAGSAPESAPDPAPDSPQNPRSNLTSSITPQSVLKQLRDHWKTITRLFEMQIERKSALQTFSFAVRNLVDTADRIYREELKELGPDTLHGLEEHLQNPNANSAQQRLGIELFLAAVRDRYTRADESFCEARRFAYSFENPSVDNLILRVLEALELIRTDLRLLNAILQDKKWPYLQTDPSQAAKPNLLGAEEKVYASISKFHEAVEGELFNNAVYTGLLFFDDSDLQRFRRVTLDPSELSAAHPLRFGWSVKHADGEIHIRLNARSYEGRFSQYYLTSVDPVRSNFQIVRKQPNYIEVRFELTEVEIDRLSRGIRGHRDDRLFPDFSTDFQDWQKPIVFPDGSSIQLVITEKKDASKTPEETAPSPSTPPQPEGSTLSKRPEYPVHVPLADVLKNNPDLSEEIRTFLALFHAPLNHALWHVFPETARVNRIRQAGLVYTDAEEKGTANPVELWTDFLRFVIYRDRAAAEITPDGSLAEGTVIKTDDTISSRANLDIVLRSIRDLVYAESSDVIELVLSDEGYEALRKKTDLHSLANLPESLEEPYSISLNATGSPPRALRLQIYQESFWKRVQTGTTQPSPVRPTSEFLREVNFPSFTGITQITPGAVVNMPRTGDHPIGLGYLGHGRIAVLNWNTPRWNPQSAPLLSLSPENYGQHSVVLLTGQENSAWENTGTLQSQEIPRRADHWTFGAPSSLTVASQDLAVISNYYQDGVTVLDTAGVQPVYVENLHDTTWNAEGVETERIGLIHPNYTLPLSPSQMLIWNKYEGLFLFEYCREKWRQKAWLSLGENPPNSDGKHGFTSAVETDPGHFWATSFVDGTLRESIYENGTLRSGETVSSEIKDGVRTLHEPKAVLKLSKNLLLVANSGNDTLRFFERNGNSWKAGRVIQSVTIAGVKTLDAPSAITRIAKNKILVANAGNGTLREFVLEGDFDDSEMLHERSTWYDLANHAEALQTAKPTPDTKPGNLPSALGAKIQDVTAEMLPQTPVIGGYQFGPTDPIFTHMINIRKIGAESEFEGGYRTSIDTLTKSVGIFRLPNGELAAVFVELSAAPDGGFSHISIVTERGTFRYLSTITSFHDGTNDSYRLIPSGIVFVAEQNIQYGNQKPIVQEWSHIDLTKPDFSVTTVPAGTGMKTAPAPAPTPPSPNPANSPQPTPPIQNPGGGNSHAHAAENPASEVPQDDLESISNNFQLPANPAPQDVRPNPGSANPVPQSPISSGVMTRRESFPDWTSFREKYLKPRGLLATDQILIQEDRGERPARILSLGEMALSELALFDHDRESVSFVSRSNPRQLDQLWIYDSRGELSNTIDLGTVRMEISVEERTAVDGSVRRSFIILIEASPDALKQLRSSYANPSRLTHRQDRNGKGDSYRLRIGNNLEELRQSLITTGQKEGPWTGLREMAQIKNLLAQRFDFTLYDSWYPDGIRLDREQWIKQPLQKPVIEIKFNIQEENTLGFSVRLGDGKYLSIHYDETKGKGLVEFKHGANSEGKFEFNLNDHPPRAALSRDPEKPLQIDFDLPELPAPLLESIRKAGLDPYALKPMDEEGNETGDVISIVNKPAQKAPTASANPAGAGPQKEPIAGPSQTLAPSIRIPAHAVRLTDWFTKWPKTPDDLESISNKFQPPLSRDRRQASDRYDFFRHTETSNSMLYVSLVPEEQFTQLDALLTSPEDILSLKISHSGKPSWGFELEDTSFYPLGILGCALSELFVVQEDPDQGTKREIYLILKEWNNTVLASLRSLKNKISAGAKAVKMKENPDGSFVITSPYTRFVMVAGPGRMEAPSQVNIPVASPNPASQSASSQGPAVNPGIGTAAPVPQVLGRTISEIEIDYKKMGELLKRVGGFNVYSRSTVPDDVVTSESLERGNKKLIAGWYDSPVSRKAVPPSFSFSGPVHFSQELFEFFLLLDAKVDDWTPENSVVSLQISGRGKTCLQPTIGRFQGIQIEELPGGLRRYLFYFEELKFSGAQIDEMSRNWYPPELKELIFAGKFSTGDEYRIIAANENEVRRDLGLPPMTPEPAPADINPSVSDEQDPAPPGSGGMFEFTKEPEKIIRHLTTMGFTQAVSVSNDITYQLLPKGLDLIFAKGPGEKTGPWQSFASPLAVPEGKVPAGIRFSLDDSNPGFVGVQVTQSPSKNSPLRTDEVRIFAESFEGVHIHRLPSGKVRWIFKFGDADLESTASNIRTNYPGGYDPFFNERMFGGVLTGGDDYEVRYENEAELKKLLRDLDGEQRNYRAESAEAAAKSVPRRIELPQPPAGFNEPSASVESPASTGGAKLVQGLDPVVERALRIDPETMDMTGSFKGSIQEKIESARALVKGPISIMNESPEHIVLAAASENFEIGILQASRYRVDYAKIVRGYGIHFKRDPFFKIEMDLGYGLTDGWGAEVGLFALEESDFLGVHYTIEPSDQFRRMLIEVRDFSKVKGYLKQLEDKIPAAFQNPGLPPDYRIEWGEKYFVINTRYFSFAVVQKTAAPRKKIKSRSELRSIPDESSTDSAPAGWPVSDPRLNPLRTPEVREALDTPAEMRFSESAIEQAVSEIDFALSQGFLNREAADPRNPIQDRAASMVWKWAKQKGPAGNVVVIGEPVMKPSDNMLLHLDAEEIIQTVPGTSLLSGFAETGFSIQGKVYPVVISRDGTLYVRAPLWRSLCQRLEGMEKNPSLNQIQQTIHENISLLHHALQQHPIAAPLKKERFLAVSADVIRRNYGFARSALILASLGMKIFVLEDFQSEKEARKFYREAGLKDLKENGLVFGVRGSVTEMRQQMTQLAEKRLDSADLIQMVGEEEGVRIINTPALILRKGLLGAERRSRADYPVALLALQLLEAGKTKKILPDQYLTLAAPMQWFMHATPEDGDLSDFLVSEILSYQTAHERAQRSA